MKLYPKTLHFYVRRYLVILFLCKFFILPCKAQDSLIPRNKLSILPVPTLGYSPETRGYIGAVCLFAKKLSKDSFTRTSNAKIELNYTQRKQAILELGWSLYLPKEKYFTSGRLHASHYPDYIWLQNDSNPSETRHIYISDRRVAEADWLFQFNKTGKWYAGLALKYWLYKNIKDAQGQTIYFHRSEQNQFYTPFGFALLKDTRNNQLNAVSGMYFKFLVQKYHGKTMKYAKVLLDGRKYFHWGSTVLALKNKFVLSNGPILDPALFGGDETARGFYLGRYRPQWFNTFQAENRFVIYRRWGLAVFGGLSYLNNNSHTSPQVLANGGAGLRFMMDRKEKINLRLDLAFGSHKNNGFYIAFGESF